MSPRQVMFHDDRGAALNALPRLRGSLFPFARVRSRTVLMGKGRPVLSLHLQAQGRLNGELSTRYGPLLQIFGVPPAGHQPAAASCAMQGYRAPGSWPRLLPKPHPKIEGVSGERLMLLRSAGSRCAALPRRVFAITRFGSGCDISMGGIYRLCRKIG